MPRIRPFVTTLTQVLGSDGGAGNGPRVRAVLGHPQTPRGGEVRIEISLRPRVARELQLTGDDTIVSLHQQRYLDEKASSLQTWCYPMRLVEQGATRLLQVSETAGRHRQVPEDGPEPGAGRLSRHDYRACAG